MMGAARLASGVGAGVQGSWFWVRDGQTRVDVDQVVGVAASVERAAQATAGAAAALSGTVNVYSAGLLFTETMQATTPAGAQYLSLVSQLGALQQAAQQGAAVLTTRCEQHAQWLAVAAAIYSAAEARILADVGATSGQFGVAALRPDALRAWVSERLRSVARSPSSALFAVPSVLAGYWHQFKLRLDGPPTVSLLGEQQVRALAGLQVGVVAKQLSGLWRKLGDITVGSTRGVMVMDEAGLSRASVAPLAVFGLTKEVSKSVQTAGVSGPFGRAHQRLLAGADRTSEAVATPVSPSSLLERIEKSEGDGASGEIQILKHTSALGAVSWSVVLAGTREWLPGSTNPQDMQSNFQAIAGEVSDQQVAATVAMDMAGIAPGEPVELVGHSQGGAVALALAANPHLASRYNFRSVLTAGSPTGTIRPPDQIPVLNLENLADPVPALDGEAARVTGDAVTVYFDPRGQQYGEDVTAHSPEVYVRALEQLEGEDAPGAQSARRWAKLRQRNLGLDGPVTSEAFYFRSTRVK